MKPCLVCGLPSPGSRCPDHQIDKPLTAHRRGYDHAWRKLSEKARKIQPFCSDCDATTDLTCDHSPEAWARRARGHRIRLQDVDVVCRSCNSRRGKARGEHPKTAGQRPEGKAQGRMNATMGVVI